MGIARGVLVVGELVVDGAVGADHGGLQGGGSGLCVGGDTLFGQDAVNVSQLGLQTHVAREVEDGVLGGVEAVVGLLELLVGQLGDEGGVTARIEAEEEVGEDLLLVLHPHDVVGLVIVALHLVEDHARDGDLTVSRGLNVPGLLLKDTAVGQKQGIEDGVHVHRHKVEVVLLVGGDEVVDGLVLKGHGVEIHRHGGLEEVDEGLLEPVVLGAVQAGVLQDVEDARIVLGEGAEAHREDHLAVVAVGVVEGSPRRLVLKLPVVGVQQGDVPVANHAEAVYERANLQIHDFFSLSMGFAGPFPVLEYT